MEKTRLWWGDALSLLEPDGQIVGVGTRYHYGDLYGHIISNMSDEYKPQVHSCFLEDGTPLFPARFSLEKLAEIKKEQSSFQFSCQYLNEPIDAENAKFKRSFFRFVETLPDELFFTTMTVDRAYGLSKTADYTGITIKKQNIQNYWYVVYAKRERITEAELIAKIFDLRLHFKVDKVGIEQMAFEHTLKPHLDDEMRRRNDFFEIQSLKASGRSKIVRIESLVPRFEAGSIFFIGNEGEYADLLEEAIRFPLARHDDILDALAYHNDEDMRGGIASQEYVIFEGGGTTGYGKRATIIRG